MMGSNDPRFLKLESLEAVRLTTGSTRTHYSALLRCAGIFTSPKRAVLGRLSQRYIARETGFAFGVIEYL